MLVDPSKTAFENMLAMLNLTNGTEYTVEDVSFGPPVIYSDAAHPDYNTKVVLSGIGDYSGTMDIFYKRLDLDREIMYRNYEGGSFANVAAFMEFVEERNEIRGDNVRLELTELPDGTAEVITRILPIDDSWLYMGDREIIFRVKDGYVPPVADPQRHYDIDVPAGTLNDGSQTFASNARVVGSIEFVPTGVVVTYDLKPDYTEVKGRNYPVALLLDQTGNKLAVLGRTLTNWTTGERYTRLVKEGEVRQTTTRTIRVLADDAVVVATPQPKSSLKQTESSTDQLVTLSYGFGAAGLGTGIDLGSGLQAGLRITRSTLPQFNIKTYQMILTVSSTEGMVQDSPPIAETWNRLGDRVLGGVDFMDASGAVIYRIEAPTYGEVLTADQSGFFAIADQIESFRIEMVSLAP